MLRAVAHRLVAEDIVQMSDQALGERFHADPALLAQLNPGVDLSKAGSVIQVPNIDGVPPLAFTPSTASCMALR